MRVLSLDELDYVFGGEDETIILFASDGGVGGGDGSDGASYDAGGDNGGSGAGSGNSVEDVVVTASMTRQEIEAANQYADDFAAWYVGAGLNALGVLGLVGILPKTAAVVGFLSNVPPAGSLPTKFISDAVFATIKQMGGMENYLKATAISGATGPL
jgi:hypothetical protein